MLVVGRLQGMELKLEQKTEGNAGLWEIASNVNEHEMGTQH